MGNVCGACHPNHFGALSDVNGCLLEDGHQGHHQFRDGAGALINWHYDEDCDCYHCCQLDGDGCTVYWEEATHD